MAFEGLTDKISAAFKKLRGKGRLTEADVKAAMREIRLALLEADVSYKVVKDFIGKVSARAVGVDVMESLTPAQMIVKIVNEELTALMGSENQKLQLASQPPTVVMLVGLQGAGKTTNGAKLAGLFKKQGRRPLLVACDIYRPAAIKQLQVVGEKVGVPVFERGQSDPVETAKLAIEHANRNLKDLVIIDTAGRLHIDGDMMAEIAAVKEAVNPAEILLVIDAMTGQDAVNVAKSFNETLELTGVIVTKLDGDTRGGAALSVKAVTGKPIKFSGIGEKLTDIEPFHPDRMASRILGMGDVLTLIEKAQSAFDEKKAAELESKMRKAEFTLEDFLDQFQQMKSMGSMQDILGMIPGMDAAKLGNVEIDEKQTARMEAIIRAMTPQERRKPDIINASRRKRIARGSGTSIQEVNRLLNQFEASRKMMKQLTNMSKGGRFKKGKKRFPFGF